MPDLPRSHLLAYALAAVAVLVFGVRQVSHSRAAQAPSGGTPIALPKGAGSGSGSGAARLVVHVAGAVRRPGVYRLRDGARVDDAVQRAGGATRRAELTQLNLAAKLQDGRQVVVPVRTPAPGSGVAAAPDTAAAPTAPAAPINLNSATLEQLDGLDGVGPVTAQKILEYREQHGGFGRIEELGEISGIGEKRLASLREQLTV